MARRWLQEASRPIVKTIQDISLDSGKDSTMDMIKKFQHRNVTLILLQDCVKALPAGT